MLPAALNVTTSTAWPPGGTFGVVTPSDGMPKLWSTRPWLIAVKATVVPTGTEDWESLKLNSSISTWIFTAFAGTVAVVVVAVVVVVTTVVVVDPPPGFTPTAKKPFI